MGEKPVTIDEILRQNECLEEHALALGECLAAWRRLYERNPQTVDPAVISKGMDRCRDAHDLLNKQCQPERRHFTDGQKPHIRDASLEFAGIAVISSIAGVGAATLFEAPAVGGYMLGFGACSAVAGWVFALMHVDPIDPNFTEVPVPSFPKLPPVRPVPNTGLTASVADAANAATANQAEAIGLLNALVIALNRSDGAAEAGDASAERRQLNAARDFAKKIGNALKHAAPLRSALARKWTGPDLDFSISKRDGLKLCDELMINGFPSPFLDALKKLGVRGKDRDALCCNLIGTLGKLENFPKFRDLLKDRKLRATEAGLTRTFQQFSRSR
jgi:hypothetical protein